MRTVDMFRAADFAHARKLYRPDAEGVLVLRIDEKSEPDIATASILEHRPVEAQQHRLLICKDPMPRRLPEGPYTLTITAPGYEPFRHHLEVTSGEVLEVAAKLEKAHRAASTLRKIVERYDIPYNEHDMRDLRVIEGKSIMLDGNSKEVAKNHHKLHITSIDRAKEIFGNADIHWPGNSPRFGRQYPAEPRREDKGDEFTFAARAAIREYIWGNSKSVSAWTETLNKFLEKEVMSIPFFVLKDIDVGPNATLYIDDAGLLCDTLSVHITGQVIITGTVPIRVEMNTYRLYGVPPSIGGGGGGGERRHRPPLTHI